MKSLRGTQTLENLMKAFAGESQARNRYTYYSVQAAKEGFRQIEAIFLETAEDEKAHARRLYELLLEGLAEDPCTVVEINAVYPVAEKLTLDNLKAAAAGENEEACRLYPAFAETAAQEGFPAAAAAFRLLAKVEAQHEKRFGRLAENLGSGRVFKKDGPVVWKCRNCGHVQQGAVAPGHCPVCQQPQEYFEVLSENY